MFTGIIESTGQIEAVLPSGSNTSFWVSSPISSSLKTDQSVSHNGVCLTVEEVINDQHRVTAIQETLSKTTLENWKPGDMINLERCMMLNGRFDGHMVQGHVDTTATCLSIDVLEGSRVYRFRFPRQFAPLVVEKGSISLEGISLTVFNLTVDEFSVAIIPYTYEHTNLKHLQAGNTVNIEFDLVGKYLARIASLKNH